MQWMSDENRDQIRHGVGNHAGVAGVVLEGDTMIILWLGARAHA